MKTIIDNNKIIEGNKLIAEFMGIKDNPNKKGYYYHPLKKDWGTIKGFKYHSSWDWLMPVVEKIRNIDWNVGQRGEYQTDPKLVLAKERLANYSVLLVGIIDVWLAVAEFIK